MKPLKPVLIAAAGCAALMAAPAAAFADPPHCPPGHAKKGECGYGYDKHYDKKHHGKHDARYDRRDDRRDDRYEQQRAYEAGYRQGLREGQYLNDDIDYRVIDDYRRYGYDAPPDGYYYAQADGQTLLVQAATRLIVQSLVNQ